MQNIKYHILNAAAVILFSYLTAITINQVVKYTISPMYNASVKKIKRVDSSQRRKTFEEYSKIFDSGFFRVASENDMTLASASGPNIGSVTELTLVGTVTGPPSIAMAMILKKGDKNPEIYKLGGTVFGYKLTAILNSSVMLKINNEIKELELYQKESLLGPAKPGTAQSGDRIKQTLSRAELQQKVFNNLDNAMKGMMAGPHRVNDQIEGYRLIKVQPNSTMYQLGARNGDIVKRVNGKALNSTERLYEMWSTIKNESNITIDIERNGKIVTYIFNINQ